MFQGPPKASLRLSLIRTSSLYQPCSNLNRLQKGPCITQILGTEWIVRLMAPEINK